MPLRTPMKNHRLIIVGKAPCVVPASPNLAIASTSETQRYERWAALGIAAATLAIHLTRPTPPGAGGAPADGRLDGDTARRKKTAAPQEKKQSSSSRKTIPYMRAKKRKE